MRLAVLDTGVFIAGIYWRNEPHKVLRAVALGLLQPVLTQQVFDEYVRAAWRLQERERLAPEPTTWLEMIQTTAIWVASVALREPVCRDSSDDKFLEAALGAGGRLVIARDRDLTVLEKPFGISMLTSRAFLAGLSRLDRRRLA